MKLNNIIFFLTFTYLTLIGLRVNAQDVHFSQFYNTPLLQNPSFAGKAEGDVRVILNHKSQWSTVTLNPFKSIGFNTDMRLNSGSKDNHFGVGVSVYSDVAGASKVRSTMVNLTAAYHLKIDSRNYFSAGLQAGINQKNTDGFNLRFNNQFDGAGHNSSLNSNENINNLSSIAPTVSAGFSYMWSNDFAKKRRNTILRKKTFNVGVAIHHINKPRITLMQLEQQGVKFITNFEGSFTTSSFWTIKPAAILAFQNKASEFIFGSLFTYSFNESNQISNENDKVTVGFGSYYRFKDALIPTFQIQYESLVFGFSYDINLSPLSGASDNNGGFEISLKFVSLNLLLGRQSKARYF